jgi:GMP synthase-like glutamine amidotransferase
MRVLFVQQDHVSSLGYVGEAFAERGFDVETLQVVPAERFAVPDVSVVFPDPLQYDVVIPLGAPWSVYDSATIGAWVADELGFLRATHDGGVPVLGICFGGQALAAALGGAVELSREPEMGWTLIDSSEPDLVEVGPWFQLHQDRWQLPPGARELATTGVASQAFVLGRSMGLQFHPELTPAILQAWLDGGDREYLLAHGVDPDALMATTRLQADAARERAVRLVDRFLLQVASAEPSQPSMHGLHQREIGT